MSRNQRCSLSLGAVSVYLFQTERFRVTSHENKGANYFGNWNQESTVDIYIRSKRQVVCQIRNRIMILPESITDNREVRADLNHPDWDDKSPSKSSQASTPSTSWTLVEATESPEKRIKASPTSCSYELSTSDGPLSLVIRRARTQSGKFVMHLLGTTGKAVGCGWRPAPNNWEGPSAALLIRLL